MNIIISVNRNAMQFFLWNKNITGFLSSNSNIKTNQKYIYGKTFSGTESVACHEVFTKKSHKF